MPRLSQDRETRSEQLREYGSSLDLGSSTPSRSRSEGTTVGEVLLWTIGIGVGAYLVIHFVLPLLLVLLASLALVVRLVIDVAVVAAVVYGIYWLVKQLTRK